MYPITLTKKLADIEIYGLRLGELEHPKFKYPWEIIVWFHQAIAQISKIKIQNQHSNLQSYQGSVLVGADVVIDDYVVFNPEAGLIIIDDKAHIGPLSYLEGPCYIGKSCTIMPQTQIRKNTSLGHTCKIGGEVSGSIFQPFSNKAHYGFIGDSYIGSWVNLGAGTSTSNLKNTYGPVRVAYQGQIIDTQLQFLGCILGDYVKTAVNTSIYTGKIIGVYAQLFGALATNVASFVICAPEGQKEFQLEAAMRTQKRMFSRRGLRQTPADRALLQQVFDKTKKERAGLIQ